MVELRNIFSVLTEPSSGDTVYKVKKHIEL
jgi:hypothetical protein